MRGLIDWARSKQTMRVAMAAALVVYCESCGGGGHSGASLPTGVDMPTARTTVYAVLLNSASGTNEVDAFSILTRDRVYGIGAVPGQLTVAVAPDGAGTLYVERRLGSADSISVYPAGGTTPSRSFDLLPHRGPVRFAVDARERVYVPGGSLNTIEVYDGNNGAHLLTAPSPINDPVCVTLDVNGTFYIAGHTPESVAVMPTLESAPSRVISGFDGPIRGIVADSSGMLFAAIGIPAQGEVQSFAAESNQVAARIPVNGASDVALDASDSLYVGTADNTVQIYQRGATTVSRIIPLGATPDSIAI
jgi:hypothetical protein